MDIRGLQKLSLLDFPETVACTVFTGGCNLRCPFCHNPSLVLPQRLANEPASLSMEALLSFLHKRRGVLDGVCVTGGEPLMQPDLDGFLREIGRMGYRVKLDTNGTYPDRLVRILDAGLVDRVAMDVKNSLARYPMTVGIPNFSTDGVEISIRLLMEGRVPYEFRTTVVRELHREEDLVSLAQTVAGAQAYVLQQFVDSGDLIDPVVVMSEDVAKDVASSPDTATPARLTGYAEAEMCRLCEAVRPWVPAVMVRGV